ncbi:MAG TPA: hypothetical protein VJB60_02715 [Candidatus Peribacterales bacterium]|nr:hypothetical protein [Candidatus Peribacterales bacterium]
MKRFLTLFLLATLFGAEKSIPVYAALDHAQNLVRLREERLLTRLLRWQDICDRREERREERLRVRGILAPHSSSDVDRACEAIADRLEEVQGVPRPNPRPSPQPSPRPSPSPSPSDDLLPNQRYRPVPPFPVIQPRSSFLILGETGPVIGSIKLSPELEPVEVRSIEITFQDPVESLQSIEVFDEVGFRLGSATLDLSASSNGDVFTLTLSPQNAYFIDEDDEVVIGLRPRLRDDDSGGESGENVRIEGIEVTAIGQWSSRTAEVTESGPDFKQHVTALTEIPEIRSTGQTTGTFSVGSKRPVGSFYFAAKDVSDSDAEPRLTDIVFSVSRSNDVSLANAVFRDPLTATEVSCTTTSTFITCSSIPQDVGNIDNPRELVLYVDVSSTGTLANPFLQIEINQPGGPTTAGDITWTDGETTFTWVPFTQPVVRGTSWD